MRTKIVFAMLLLLAAACSKTPDEPTFDNPFDPNGTNPADGYSLQVVSSGQSIAMTWKNTPGVYSYDVYWSDTTDELASMTKIEDQLRAPLTPGVQFVHDNFTAERTNWYRVVAWEAIDSGDPDEPFQAGRALEPSHPVALDIAAMLALADGATSTPTRFVELELLTGVADSVEVSNRRSFLGSVTFPVNPGTVTRVPWELATTLTAGGAAVKNNDELRVHFRTRMTGSVGSQDSTLVKVSFAPKLLASRGLRAQPGGHAMVDTVLTTTIGAIPGQVLGSVVRNRADSLKLDVWHLVEDVTPPSLTDPVVVFWDPATEPFRDGQLVSTMFSDFGFSASTTLRLKVPGPMATPEISIPGGNHTTTRDIQVISKAANAGYISLSENADFAGATWVAWADTLDYQLENVYGTRFLYAAYTNPLLAETKVTSTLVSLVSPPARVRR